MTDTANLTERMLFLSQIPVAAWVPPRVLRAIATYLAPRTFAPGEIVIRRGEPVEAMYLLVDGGLALVRDEKKIGELDAPQTIGFLGILARQEATYDAIAKGDVRAYELETDTLLELFEDHFPLYAATLRYLAERLYFDMKDLPQEMLGMPSMDLGTIGDRQPDLIEHVLMLRKTSAFSTANVNALASMVRGMEPFREAAFTRLWGPGDRPDRALFLLEGTALCRTDDGRVFRYGPGTTVGGLELLCGQPRWYEVLTETPCVGLWGSTDDLLDLFEHQFRMAMDFVSALARAQLGLLDRRAKLGQNPLAAVRQIKKVGTVRYGA
ncbi:MAG TPA: cyclic nucleotide-binding domain-containing protein [Labilithrix sp.]